MTGISAYENAPDIRMLAGSMAEVKPIRDGYDLSSGRNVPADKTGEIASMTRKG